MIPEEIKEELKSPTFLCIFIFLAAAILFVVFCMLRMEHGMEAEDYMQELLNKEVYIIPDTLMHISL